MGTAKKLTMANVSTTATLASQIFPCFLFVRRNDKRWYLVKH
jgi:hypothetical protein